MLHGLAQILDDMRADGISHPDWHLLPDTDEALIFRIERIVVWQRLGGD